MQFSDSTTLAYQSRYYADIIRDTKNKPFARRNNPEAKVKEKHIKRIIMSVCCK
jgi:hypothetical protein